MFYTLASFSTCYNNVTFITRVKIVLIFVCFILFPEYQCEKTKENLSVTRGFYIIRNLSNTPGVTPLPCNAIGVYRWSRCKGVLGNHFGDAMFYACVMHVGRHICI